MAWKLKEEIKRSSTGIAILLAAAGIVASILISQYYYNKGLHYGKVFYQIEQVLVFDESKIALQEGDVPIRITDGGGNLIRGNIQAASITIWNGGNEEIKTESVREALTISVESNPRVIDLSPTFYTENNHDQFLLKDNKITWKYFDPGEGLKARLVYVSRLMRDIRVNGYVSGTGQPVYFQSYYQNSLYNPKNIVSWLQTAITVLFMAAVAYCWLVYSNWHILGNWFFLSYSALNAVLVVTMLLLPSSAVVYKPPF